LALFLQALASLSQQAAEKLRVEVALEGRLEQLEAWLAELEARNRELERGRAEAEKKFTKEKRGKEHARFCADSFALGLMVLLVKLEKANSAMARDLKACTKANEEFHTLCEATDSREATTDGKLRVERKTRKGMVRKPPSLVID